MPTLRLLSVDARTTGDRAGLGRLISDSDADVVCLHGAPYLVRWRARTAHIARRSARVVVDAGGRGSGANALLSTLGVDVVLTRQVRFDGSPWRAPAGAAIAVLRCGGVRFTLAAATLCGDVALRLHQAAELQHSLARLVPDDPPAIVSALHADRPGAAAWQALADGRVALADRLFVDERIAVADSRPVGGTAALLAVMDLDSPRRS